MSSRWLSMRARIAACLVLAVTAGVVGSPAARSDWDPGDYFKMHYPQLPDLTPTGLDVNATFPKILADDWECTFTGPVSDIHIWGSWLNDRLPNGVADQVLFKLSIHEDIPVGPGGFSIPGDELWSGIFGGGFLPFSYRIYATVPPPGEGFYDPNTDTILGTDMTIWQYNFEGIPNPFIQQVGTIYWLDVQALPLDPLSTFGWKTTNPVVTPHFRDDAVWADTAMFGGPPVTPWDDLRYPIGHPYEGQSIDLAFVITTVPEPSTFVLAGIGLGGLVLVARKRSRVGR